MANLMLGYLNRIDTATLAGSGWEADLPLDNLKTPHLSQVARNSSKIFDFDIDLGAAMSLRTISLINHNLSQTGLWAFTLGTTVGGYEVYSSGYQYAWSMNFDNGLMSFDAQRMFAAIGITPSTSSARYVRIYIHDLSNADGYVQIGRVFIGNVFQPTYNAVLGLKDSWVDPSTIQRAASGAVFVDARRRYRQVEFALNHLSESEGEVLHELMRRHGTVSEVMYLPYPDDAAKNQRYGFIGRLSELNPMDYPYYKTRSLPFRIEEAI